MSKSGCDNKAGRIVVNFKNRYKKRETWKYSERRAEDEEEFSNLI